MSSDDAIVVKNNRSLTPMLIMRPTSDGRVDVQVGEGWTMTEACREFLDTIKRLNAEARGVGGTTETTDTKDEKEANEDEA